MLAALAFFLAQKPPYAVFDAFVKDTGKAILEIGQGVWEMTNTDGKAKETVFVQGNASKQVWERDGKPLTEFVVASSFAIYVDHEEKSYRRVGFSEYHGEWAVDRLERMDEEGVELRLDPQRGIVLRTDPPVGAAKVATLGQEETLVAAFRKKGGVRYGLELVRDTKSKLPIRLIIRKGDLAPETVTFAFVRREVYPFELTIEPAAYAGYRKVPFGSGR